MMWNGRLWKLFVSQSYGGKDFNKEQYKKEVIILPTSQSCVHCEMDLKEAINNLFLHEDPLNYIFYKFTSYYSLDPCIEYT